jgi:hypothetical protein
MKILLIVLGFLMLVMTSIGEDKYEYIPDATPGGDFISSIVKDVNEGPVTVELGDGYTLSFRLEDTEESPYDICQRRDKTVQL